MKQCRNGGIDCKIHGLQVVGKKRSEEDAFSSNLSFLTSDSEEFDDQVRLQVVDLFDSIYTCMYT